MDPLSMSMTVLVGLVALALICDFINGFHDAANSIATIVTTGVLKPFQAVLWAASFNMLAFFFFELKVAATVGKGIIDPSFIDHIVIFGALSGAISWNLITWWLGIPSSSSHALIGGMIGAAMLKTGPAALMGSGIAKTLVFILVAPLLGFVLSSLIVIATAWLLRGTTPRRVDRWFRRLQLISSGLYSLGHGANDAQKTMGIIWLLLISANLTSRDHLPSWVIWSAYLAIGLGTLFGGWRIVKTMGQGITRLKPVGGFAAETGGAMSLFIASGFGIPVSTTHTITGSIVGVGAADRMSAVRWAVAGRIVWAWIITIPASGMLAAVAYLVGSKFL